MRQGGKTGSRTPPRPRTVVRGIVTALVVAGVAFPGHVTPANAAPPCTLYASPTGQDSNPGTLETPYRTAQKLVSSSAAGQIGCLRGGTYREDVKISSGGRAGAPVTLRSYPRERAKLIGRLWIALGADYVTVSHLYLDGTNATHLPSPTVNADRATFQRNEITDNHTGICLLLGSDWGPAHNAVIDGNRIHDCGRLPATNHDHGIYASWTTGAQIANNLIYDNADRGIQLYPNVQRATIQNNVIDANGQGIIFSGADGVASSNNLVKSNVIANSKIRHNVESWYPVGNPIGVGNVVRNNCVYGGAYGGANGGIESPQVGFAARGNTVFENAGFVRRIIRGERVRIHGRCRVAAARVAKIVETRRTR